MEAKTFPVIDLVATGDNIRRLRVERGLSVKDLQHYFGFEEPRAVYKWQNGECLPTVDNLYALGVLLETPMEAILVRRKPHSPANKEQQDGSCCSAFQLFRVRRVGFDRNPFCRRVRFVTSHGSDAVRLSRCSPQRVKRNIPVERSVACGICRLSERSIG